MWVKFCVFFSAHVGSQDVFLVELLAILCACELIGSRHDLSHRPLTIISDSLSAVKWVLGCFPGCNSHDQVLQDIRMWLSSFSLVSVEFRDRSTNSFADSLAKKGLNPAVDVVRWSVF
ncbi:hypothetical protein LWI29_017529 [Acer saccharum]|uniref:RNase H type-1 domain-containing protein n=1 Tax=Acer saccharum TaxID=4024 RepID=A0AA39T4J5_ACESA|nr:hypothetical protein LWI29_017529 [Acer saccharum]